MKRNRIYYCAAAGCHVNTRSHPLERLFRFPRSSRNLDRYLKWVEFANNPRLRKDKPVEAYMCARHFTRNQFRTEYQMTLVYQAVPTIPSDECPDQSFSAKCRFKAPYDEEIGGGGEICDSSDGLREPLEVEEEEEEAVGVECSQTEGDDCMTGGGESDEEERLAVHLRDHCYWSPEPPLPTEDHTYHTNGARSPPPPLSEEHPRLTPADDDDPKTVVEEEEEELEVSTSSSYVEERRSYVQRERQLVKILRKKERAVKRLSQRYRDKCATVKQLTASNAQLSRLVEALTNSVSVCCDLLGVHDVVFKT